MRRPIREGSSSVGVEDSLRLGGGSCWSLVGLAVPPLSLSPFLSATSSSFTYIYAPVIHLTHTILHPGH